MFVDENNNRIPKDFAVYKDLMVYGYLHKGEHFGGRVLMKRANIRNMQKQFEREKQLKSNAHLEPEIGFQPTLQGKSTLSRSATQGALPI